MRDTVWTGKPQKLVMADGTPKGAAMILEERGIQTRSLVLDDMRVLLANHPDFKHEKNALDTMLGDRGHTAVFLLKFHCELNGIERVWGHSNVPSVTIPWPHFVRIHPTLDSIPTETIQHYIQRSRNYMHAYLGGNKPGSEMEKVVKKLSKEYKSHRRVGTND